MIKRYPKHEEWSIVEEGFDPANHQASESIFSLGNGYMGQRANFEEFYSGKSLQGSYIAGVYYPDKTRVGWWKNGYPEYFAKVINSANWIGIDVHIDGQRLDLATMPPSKFVRELNMRQGYLSRSFSLSLPGKQKVDVTAQRFLSMARPEIGVVKYQLTASRFDGELELCPFIDGDVKNEDANYNEKFWTVIETGVANNGAFVLAQTRKLDFKAGFYTAFELFVNNEKSTRIATPVMTDHSAGGVFKISLREGDEVTLIKYVAVVTNLNISPEKIVEQSRILVSKAMADGFDKVFAEHSHTWDEIWSHADIVIRGDKAAQQGIRFNIFQLNQTYRGNDERLNIGPKGFTGEKYGGSTYWDTEAYCIPFFLATAPASVTRNLLKYRYKHLPKAIENAHKLGFMNGAALYPMVTMNGEECHNEWEITFEEIHRNGAIAFAIFNYLRHTGDYKYLSEYGLEVLIGIARFWAQRVNWSEPKGMYVILGVTGPNEYENNINNNWYTNLMAQWCFRYTVEAIGMVRNSDAPAWDTLAKRISYTPSEGDDWTRIADNLYFPFDKDRNIFLQQEGYLDKDIAPANQIDPAERPINQNWSWDRILRSCYIKQADTLQGMYLFEENYDTDTLRRHFDFYEPRTVHESSLSPCVHAILAARIGYIDKACEMYLRTSRLDLDDYNHEVHEGLHITSMAGTWMSVVEGFGGKRIAEGRLSLSPVIPGQWLGYSFRILYHDTDIQVTVDESKVTLLCGGKKALQVILYGEEITIFPGQPHEQEMRK